ncbi:MAG: DGQHR domain-containing protein [Thermoproteota archaeon]
MEVKSLQIKQWGYGVGAEPVYLYVTALPMKILENAEIDRYSRTNREGYQRQPLESRVKPTKGSVVKYILEEMGVFPTSVLLNVRDTKLEFRSEGKITENIEYGALNIGDKTVFWIIDGQHRIEALKRAQKEHPELSEYPLPVTITNMKNKFEELVQFYIVNSRQKKIPTGIAYRHMQRMYQEVKIKGEYKWLENVILGPVQERQALASEVVDYLDAEISSPFAGAIRYQGEDKEEWHLVNDDVLIRYISTLFREKALSSMRPEELADLLVMYWSAIKELYPKPFDPKLKDAYTLLKHTGIASFTYLFPFIYGLCAKEGKIDKENMRAKLELLQRTIPEDIGKELDPDFRRPIDEEWWSRAHGSSLATLTSEKAFRDIYENMAKKISLLLTSK